MNTKITNEISDAIDRGKKPYPFEGGNIGVYWDLGIIQTECVKVTEKLLKILVEEIKTKHDLTLDADTIISDIFK